MNQGFVGWVDVDRVYTSPNAGFTGNSNENKSSTKIRNIVLYKPKNIKNLMNG